MKHKVNVTATEVNVKPLKNGQLDLTFEMDDFDLGDMLDEFDSEDILMNLNEEDIIEYVKFIGYTVSD